jgi:hypothetical protein
VDEQTAPLPTATRTPLRTSRRDISHGPSAAPNRRIASGIVLFDDVLDQPDDTAAEPGVLD